jgi:seryl-tRNA synthetase
MLDIRYIRENIEAVKQGAIAKGENPETVDEALRLDEHRRSLLQKTESLKSRRNSVSGEVARLKSRKEDATPLIAEMRQVGEEIKALDDELRDIAQKLRGALLEIPNLPHPTVPLGSTPKENQVLAVRGEKPDIDFAPLPHWDLLEKLHLVDFVRGTKIAGAGFPVFVGRGAILERALINFFLDEASSRGYTELQPPLMVNAESATGTGQLPDKEDLMYEVARDGFYLIPTAEVPVSNFFRGEILSEELLPAKYCASTACFRREAGSYGKDVRGLNRVHQFDKVELVSFVHPSRSYEELESMREEAERLLQMLGLRYRVLLMCSGDLGFTQAKKYDLEVWSMGQDKWLEVSSISNFEGYQARRMNIRYRPRGGGKPEIVHTLNGSALALPRTVAALLEYHQTPEGKVVVPKVLQKYTGFEVIG